jgi:hypothetical protein
MLTTITLVILGCSSTSSIINDNPLKITYYADENATNMLLTATNTVLPTVLKKVAPIYHSVAIRAGLEGYVTSKVFVRTSGLPRKIIRLDSDQIIFEEGSMVALQSWQFTPLTINGEQKEFTAIITFRFRLINGNPTVILPE